MKITMENIKEYIKLLKEIPYYPVDNKSTLFFEIDTGVVVDSGDFVMELKNNNSGAAGTLRPGLVLNISTNEKGKVFADVFLAYAQIEYSPEFSLSSYLNLVRNTGKVGKNSREKLTSLECRLVKNDYIMAKFEI